VLGIVFIGMFFLWAGTPFVLIPGLLFLALAVAGFLLAREAQAGETPPDPVTGGRRWWQKRWDE
jgi:high-affinity Fe2+/Pb2+ permease